MVVKRLGKIAIGCTGIIVILIILGLIFSGVIVNKIIRGVVQQKTGIVQTNTDSSSPGVSYTDPKTGATINLGSNKVPDSFPKDFPIYPGATIETSQTGNGFWLTLTTKDDIQKVNSFYQDSFTQYDWKAENSETNEGFNWVVAKNNLTGYLVLSNRNTPNNQTSIIIVLGAASPLP